MYTYINTINNNNNNDNDNDNDNTVGSGASGPRDCAVPEHRSMVCHILPFHLCMYASMYLCVYTIQLILIQYMHV